MDHILASNTIKWRHQGETRLLRSSESTESTMCEMCETGSVTGDPVLRPILRCAVDYMIAIPTRFICVEVRMHSQKGILRTGNR
jgi:hypothetical protein